MATTAQKLGPGLLTFGDTGTTQEFGSQVTKCTLEPKFDEGDPIPVLSGDEVPGDDTETASLKGEFLQEYSMASLLAWCRTNSGETLPFTFRPNLAGALAVKGEATIRAVTIGGDVKAKNTAEFEFPVKSTWSIVDAGTAPGDE